MLKQIVAKKIIYECDCETDTYPFLSVILREKFWIGFSYSYTHVLTIIVAWLYVQF